MIPFHGDFLTPTLVENDVTVGEGFVAITNGVNDNVGFLVLNISTPIIGIENTFLNITVGGEDCINGTYDNANFLALRQFMSSSLIENENFVDGDGRFGFEIILYAIFSMYSLKAKTNTITDVTMLAIDDAVGLTALIKHLYASASILLVRFTAM
jgi:hypothetical protein